MKPFITQKLPIPDIDWEALIPMIGSANRSIAQYNGVLYGVPNPEVLLSPLTTREAVLSSRIEGPVATLGEVLKFEAGEQPEQESKSIDIQEIINYRRALQYGFRVPGTRVPGTCYLMEHPPGRPHCGKPIGNFDGRFYGGWRKPRFGHRLTLWGRH